MMKQMNIIPDLELGETYVIGGNPIVVKLADENGCKRCALVDDCARFEKKSKLKDYHVYCAGAYRFDRQSVVFVNK
jgi:hypothetical protein